MRMRRHATALLVGFTLLLSACGGGGSDALSGEDAETTAAPASGAVEDGPRSGFDCAKLRKASQQLASVQLLAQLDNPQTIGQLKANPDLPLDLDAFLEAMETLHQLDGVETSIGDPKESIDFYKTTADLAQVLFAADPPTQGAIDEYQATLGERSDFLSRQAVIAAGLDAVGC